MADVDTSAISSATKNLDAVRDVPQSVSVCVAGSDQEAIYAEYRRCSSLCFPASRRFRAKNNRDQVVIRGNRSSADFFVDGVRTTFSIIAPL